MLPIPMVMMAAVMTGFNVNINLRLVTDMAPVANIHPAVMASKDQAWVMMVVTVVVVLSHVRAGGNRTGAEDAGC